jgi:hypothetical protein
MSDGVLIAIISSITSVVIAFLTVIVKTWMDNKKLQKKAETDESMKCEDVGDMMYVQEYLENLRKVYHFDRVGICQFHNGGKFFKGHSMKKFTMSYEATAPGIEKIKRNIQNVMVSEFPHLINGLLTHDSILLSQSSEGYPNTTREMASAGVIVSVYIPIRGLSGDLGGFIICQNIVEHKIDIDKTLIDELIDMSNQISGYLVK